MEALNALNEQDNKDVWTEGYYIMLSILEPIIPHICWELSDKLIERKNLRPIEILEEVFVESSQVLAVTVNGKRRAEIEVDMGASKEAILETAKAEVASWVEGKEMVKEILVPGKLVNLVVK